MSAFSRAATPESCDVAVIGGGFYGLRIAILAASLGRTTVVLERESRFLSRGSFNNQARVHGGYHYPRSILTAVRARHLYSRFATEYAAAVTPGIRHIYAIARHQTKVGAREFAEFCRRIGAPLSPAPQDVERLFDPNVIEQAFVADEAVFDAYALADLTLERAAIAGVQSVGEFDVDAIEPGRTRRIRLRSGTGDKRRTIEADCVINATYSALNGVVRRSGLKRIPLVHELAEVALVRAPDAMQFHGITVMDGPFWSCLPFPAVHGMHSLTHVRHTPHMQWRTDEHDAPETVAALVKDRASRAPLMQRDAVRFVPAMATAKHVTSLWEMKVVLPRSDGDDSRPILAHVHTDAPGFVSVLGAKIDSVYDVEDSVRELLATT